MADANKVKFGLSHVHYALITGYDSDGIPTYGTPVSLPGAVSMSLDVNGEASNFYADNGIYYVINNNAGYDGDLEVALVTTDFATSVLGEIMDDTGVLVETTKAEIKPFALMFEFNGDQKHIRHVLYYCTASRAAVEGDTIEEETEVKTESLSLTAGALVNGVVKAKTCEDTDSSTYASWYDKVFDAPLDPDYGD